MTDVPAAPVVSSDPGLAAERTELAWGRSALALIACGAAVARGDLPGLRGGEVGATRPLVGGALLVLGALVWLAGLPLAKQRARAAAGEGDARRPARQHELAPLAIGSAVVGVAAFLIAAFVVT